MHSSPELLNNVCLFVCLFLDPVLNDILFKHQRSESISKSDLTCSRCLCGKDVALFHHTVTCKMICDEEWTIRRVHSHCFGLFTTGDFADVFVLWQSVKHKSKRNYKTNNKRLLLGHLNAISNLFIENDEFSSRRCDVFWQKVEQKCVFNMNETCTWLEPHMCPFSFLLLLPSDHRHIKMTTFILFFLNL